MSAEAVADDQAGSGAAAGDWQRACALSEITDDLPIHVDVAGRPVAIARSEGNLYAIYDVCSHEDVALSEGEVYESKIECWLHSSLFDLKTGAPLGLPATKPVPVYPVRVDGSGPDADVLIDISASS